MFDAVVIGNGPAGTGLLSCLLRQSISDPEANIKVCVIDSQPADKTGHIGKYNISSDTQAQKFLTCLEGLPRSILMDPQLVRLIDSLRSYGTKGAPLQLVGDFCQLLGTLTRNEMISRGQLDFRPRTQAIRAIWQDERWQVVVRSNGHDETLQTAHLVMACGADEPMERLELFLEPYGLTSGSLNSVRLSSRVLMAETTDAIFEKLKSLKSPKVAIVGGSHSAISSACKLLSGDIDFERGAISIFHRSPMQVTFDSPQDAIENGVTEFDEADVCPLTGRVFALKGFRLDSRDLFMAIKGYGGRAMEERVVLVPLDQHPASHIKKELLAADLVISALGYSPNYIALDNADKAEPITLNAPAFVNEKSQLLESNGRVAPNCFALGLASNYNLAGRFGEPSFVGQANGLVLWHKDIGMELAASLLGADR